MRTFTLIVGLILTIGCSKNPTDDKVIGEWREKFSKNPSTVTFNANGNFVYVERIFEKSLGEPEILTGFWRIKGREIIAIVVEQNGKLISNYHFKITPAGDILLFKANLVGDKVGEFEQSRSRFFEGPFAKNQ